MPKPLSNNVNISPDTQRKVRIPPGQYEVDELPVLHHGDVPKIDTSKWRFTIQGLVAAERSLIYDEFMGLPRVQVFCDIHCVTSWSKLDNLWEGVSTAVMKDIVDILPEARFVMVHGSGGFTTNLSLEDFFANDVLFALKYDKKDLTPEHGYPARLVVPRLYFWKSAKWVTGIEFMKNDKPGFWESRGYHIHGDPWTQERYSEPSPHEGSGI